MKSNITNSCFCSCSKYESYFSGQNHYFLYLFVSLASTRWESQVCMLQNTQETGGGGEVGTDSKVHDNCDKSCTTATNVQN